MSWPRSVGRSHNRRSRAQRERSGYHGGGARNMSRTCTMLCRVVVVILAAVTGASVRAQTTLPAAPRAATPQVARPNLLAGAGALFTEHCQGCHGSDLAGGRAPSLFDEKWLTSTRDDEILRSVRNGVAGSEMKAFKDKLN